MLGTLAHAPGVPARAVPSQLLARGCEPGIARYLRGWEPRLHGISARVQRLRLCAQAVRHQDML
jgi:hypothetical protein